MKKMPFQALLSRQRNLKIKNIVFVISLILILFFNFLFLYGKEETVESKRVLEDQGYQNVVMTGHVLIGCTPLEFYKTGFVASGPTGRSVKGIVCGTVWKTFTIRLF